MIIKSEENTSKKFGKHPEERTLEEAIRNSVVIVDKNSGPTSHQVTAWVKSIFNAKQAGHAGTLGKF